MVLPPRGFNLRIKHDRRVSSHISTIRGTSIGSPLQWFQCAPGAHVDDRARVPAGRQSDDEVILHSAGEQPFIATHGGPAAAPTQAGTPAVKVRARGESMCIAAQAAESGYLARGAFAALMLHPAHTLKRRTRVVATPSMYRGSSAPVSCHRGVACATAMAAAHTFAAGWSANVYGHQTM